MSNIKEVIRQTCQKSWWELPRRASNELHFIINDGEDLLRLFRWAKDQNYYLCTMVINDERSLEDHVFKLYYVLSSPLNDRLQDPSREEPKLVILEHPLSDPQYREQYISIREVFPSAEWLEKESYDLIGLSPRNFQSDHGFVLQEYFPEDLYPLRPRRSMKSLKEKIEEHRKIIEENKKKSPEQPPILPDLPEGMLYLPVGPIHAGIIEAGQFLFHIGGEVIEDVTIRLGYKHRGIEKLFQTQYTLEKGCELAERISGDSSFAHSMAYCQAVEALAGIELTEKVLCCRAVFLELERIYNHISDIAALVHDMAFDLVSSQISVLREKVVRLNNELTGHRLLRHVNYPGGIQLNKQLDFEKMNDSINQIVKELLYYSELVLKMPDCRNRAIDTGILTSEEAKNCGATGLVARASCLRNQDFRLKHPTGIYKHSDLQDEILNTLALEEKQPSEVERILPIFSEDLQGDVFARMALRVAEAETSARIIEKLSKKLKKFSVQEPLQKSQQVLAEALKSTPNYEFGLGYVEGWRGDIFYWIMKGPDNSIFRCKVRDPSLFNWPALRIACNRKERKPETEKEKKRGNQKKITKLKFHENILADFPLINKSFNLSYSGHDL